ncbi:RNA polymerase-binding protein DksA [Ottowia pentelensis]
MKPAAAKTPAKAPAQAQALPGKATPQASARATQAVTKKAAPARPRTAAARKPTPMSAAPAAVKPKILPMPIAAVAHVPIVIKKDPKLANNWKTKKPDELSDAEVIAMPDDEYMNDKQLAFFRLKLTQLKDDILLNADVTTDNLRKDTVVVPDPADRATIEEEHALELRTRDRERKLLKKIEQSIARIDAGDYGYCDETGEPIGVPRLLARPTATLSLEAQQRRELKQKMFGD